LLVKVSPNAQGSNSSLAFEKYRKPVQSKRSAKPFFTFALPSTWLCHRLIIIQAFNDGIHHDGVEVSEANCSLLFVAACCARTSLSSILSLNMMRVIQQIGIGQLTFEESVILG